MNHKLILKFISTFYIASMNNIKTVMNFDYTKFYNGSFLVF